ncbi:hypothetical protein SCLCIDRAFT_1213053 [Scleroderma citrinum Foug A]|uniref:Uncharacterized protein n=1 Tax=Scleroderma citrinum Foug A TaxID=1036808 RepID=A0A0C3E800_9AGAM|nr:hypothetical protein SCLCIDRAFT_1213053 [Scleroderma citrinum Foug A]
MACDAESAVRGAGFESPDISLGYCMDTMSAKSVYATCASGPEETLIVRHPSSLSELETTSSLASWSVMRLYVHPRGSFFLREPFVLALVRRRST